MAKSIVAMNCGIVRRDDPLQARSRRLELAKVVQGVTERPVGGEIETGILSTLGHVDELLGEASCGVELSSVIVKVPETVQRRKLLCRVAQLLAQLQRSPIGSPRFRGRVALGGSQGGPHRRQQVQLAPRPLGAFRHGAKHLQPLGEVCGRLQIGRSLERPLARALPVGHGFAGASCLGVVTGEQLGLGLDDLGELLSRISAIRACDLLAPALEQRLVGGVLDQGVLEAVGRLGRRAAAEDQLGCDQLVEGRAELGFGQGRDRGKQFVAELATDHGADLRDLLDRGEAVEPGHQRVVQGRRDRERRQRAGQLVVVAGVG